MTTGKIWFKPQTFMVGLLQTSRLKQNHGCEASQVFGRQCCRNSGIHWIDELLPMQRSRNQLYCCKCWLSLIIGYPQGFLKMKNIMHGIFFSGATMNKNRQECTHHRDHLDKCSVSYLRAKLAWKGKDADGSWEFLLSWLKDANKSRE